MAANETPPLISIFADGGFRLADAVTQGKKRKGRVACSQEGGSLDTNRISRRSLLGGAVAGAAGAAVALNPSETWALTRGSSKLPGPGTLPNPSAAPGTDQLPEISTIILLMLENHTYDNLLGMLQGRGDGFTISNGEPVNSNPWPKNSVIAPPGKDAVLTAFPMPDPCQENGHPYNTWKAGHVSYHGGKMTGFVKSDSGPVSMGYYDSSLMPFLYSLAGTFPLCDQYFSSVMAQTYPNRRYAMAGTSLGLTADTLNTDKPPNGTIFEALNKYGISWKNYYAKNGPDASNPSSLIWLYLVEEPSVTANLVDISEFYSDAAAGTLPAFCMIDPNFGTNSEEDPQDVQLGDQFHSQVVNAVMTSPQWSSTLLLWTYDEGGGYYDHVPPPKAPKPDSVRPILSPGDPPGQFNRYGFRVPAGIVSPYAKPDYVSTVVHDHTSVLKLLETKWNLPAFTYRDANADNLLDSVDLTSPPAFATPPTLAAPADPTILEGCLSTGPGTIPPAGYVTTK